MKIVFVTIYNNGEDYKDEHEWPIGVYTDKKTAEREGEKYLKHENGDKEAYWYTQGWIIDYDVDSEY